MICVDRLLNHIADKHYIYHYTKRDVAIEHILPNKKLRFNSFYRTNDPLEFENFQFSLAFESNISNEDVRNASSKAIKINQMIKRAFKICCFSRDVPFSGINGHINNQGFCRSRMWSQYGDNHKGVCLIFDNEKLLQALQKNLKSILPPTGTIFEICNRIVQYDDSLKELKEALEINIKKSINLKPIEILRDILGDLIFTKLKDYEHEQEYRIAILSESFSDLQTIDASFDKALLGIILGCRYPDSYKINLKTFANEITILQMDWFNGKPHLTQVFV